MCTRGGNCRGSFFILLILNAEMPIEWLKHYARGRMDAVPRLLGTALGLSPFLPAREKRGG